MAKPEDVVEMARTLATFIAAQKLTGRTVITIDSVNGGIRRHFADHYRNYIRPKRLDTAEDLIELVQK